MSPVSLYITSPETAPSDVVLAQILQICRLSNQSVHLKIHVKFFVRLEIASCQLLLNPGQHLQGPSILHLFSLCFVCWSNAGSMTRAERTSISLHLRTNYRGTTLRRERWLWRRFTVAKPPCEQGIMNELKRLLALGEWTRSMKNNLRLRGQPSLTPCYS
jgi:hypothetical protein